MKLLLYGATGNIGSRILIEAMMRGHEVTAVVREPAKMKKSHHLLTIAQGDVLDVQDVRARAGMHDAVLNAVGPDREVIVGSAVSLIQGLAHGGKRLLVLGGVGSLRTEDGVRFVDSPDFPNAFRLQALANCEALDLYRGSEEVDWTFLSPPIWIKPGRRTGRYLAGKDTLLFDSDGTSWISTEDYAVAFLDEIERPQHIRERFTVVHTSAQ